jgi:hypothetical protein
MRTERGKQMTGWNLKAVVAIGLLAGLLVNAGCSSGDPDRLPTYPVEGTVLLNGKPVAGADVVFMYSELQRASFGRTDDQGKFKLGTYENFDGALAGAALVSVSKYEQEKVSSAPIAGEPGYDPSKAYAKSEPPKSLIPLRYADFKTSLLKANIEASRSNQSIVLELTDR